jgi:5'-3' exonuclease
MASFRRAIDDHPAFTGIDTVLAVDGSNILMRSIRAMEGASLSVDGVPTAAIVAFIGTISRYVRELRPMQIAVFWDDGHAHRSALFDGYKSERASRGDHHDATFALALEFLTLVGVYQRIVRNEEADDLIAAQWRIRDPEKRFVILSSDKDMLQLLGPNVEQYRPGDSMTDRWTDLRVQSHYGCRPEHLALAMAMAGDKIDCIPGVPGVGMKTAVKWLSQHGWSLEKLFDANLPRLAGYHDLVMRNIKLIDLRTGGPQVHAIPLPAFRAVERDGGAMSEALVEFFDRWKLAAIKDRWTSGSMWSDRPAQELEKPSRTT